MTTSMAEALAALEASGAFKAEFQRRKPMCRVSHIGFLQWLAVHNVKFQPALLYRYERTDDREMCLTGLRPCGIAELAVFGLYLYFTRLGPQSRVVHVVEALTHGAATLPALADDPSALREFNEVLGYYGFERGKQNWCPRL